MSLLPTGQRSSTRDLLPLVLKIGTSSGQQLQIVIQARSLACLEIETSLAQLKRQLLATGDCPLAFLGISWTDMLVSKVLLTYYSFSTKNGSQVVRKVLLIETDEQIDTKLSEEETYLFQDDGHPFYRIGQASKPSILAKEYTSLSTPRCRLVLLARAPGTAQAGLTRLLERGWSAVHSSTEKWYCLDKEEEGLAYLVMYLARCKLRRDMRLNRTVLLFDKQKEANYDEELMPHYRISAINITAVQKGLRYSSCSSSILSFKTQAGRESATPVFRDCFRAMLAEKMADDLARY